MPSRIDQRRLARPAPHHLKSSPVDLIKRFFRFLFLGLLLLVIITVVLLLVTIHQTSALSSTQNILFVQSNLDGKEASIILAQFSPENSKIEVGVFPASFPVDILGGYGQYPLRSVFPLLSLDKKTVPFVTAAYTHALKIPIDTVVSFSGNPKSAESAKLSDLLWGLLTYRFHSTLSFVDRLRLYQFALKVDQTQSDLHPIDSLNMWQKVKPQFRFSNLSNDCAVAVLNTTQTAGTGSSIAQVLEESGVSIIRLTDTPNQLEQTKILINKPEPFCQEVVSQLPSLFPFSTQVELNTQTMSTYRANIVILIGQDFAQEFAKKPHQQ